MDMSGNLALKIRQNAFNRNVFYLKMKKYSIRLLYS